MSVVLNYRTASIPADAAARRPYQLRFSKISATDAIFHEAAMRDAAQIVNLIGRIRTLNETARLGPAAEGKTSRRSRAITHRLVFFNLRADDCAGGDVRLLPGLAAGHVDNPKLALTTVAVRLEEDSLAVGAPARVAVLLAGGVGELPRLALAVSRGQPEARRNLVAVQVHGGARRIAAPRSFASGLFREERDRRA